MSREVEPAPRISTPAPAWTLGALGLIPFAAASGVYALGEPRYGGPALLALVTYAAAILSFLGGVRWGAEILRTDRPRWLTLGASNVAPLIGWGLLAAPFATAPLQLSGFIAAFLGQWLWDQSSSHLPPWYARLRTLLTLGACLALGVALERALDG